MKELKDRVAVVTGAAGGIGRALVMELARAGMHLVLAGRDAQGMAVIAQEVRALGRRCSVVRTDVRYLEQVENLLAQTLAEHGGCHLVINNAGPVRLLINRVGQERSWVGVRLLTRDGRDALGAWVGVFTTQGTRHFRRLSGVATPTKRRDRRSTGDPCTHTQERRRRPGLPAGPPRDRWGSGLRASSLRRSLRSSAPAPPVLRVLAQAMNCSSSLSSADFGLAPTMDFTTSPPW